MAGRFGVQAALDGHTGQMVAFERETDTAASEPVHAAAAVSNAADLGAASASCVKHRNTVYKIHPVLKDVNLICNQEKKVPAEWITKNGTDVSDDFLAYSQPLIKGTFPILWKTDFQNICTANSPSRSITASSLKSIQAAEKETLLFILRMRLFST